MKTKNIAYHFVFLMLIISCDAGNQTEENHKDKGDTPGSVLESTSKIEIDTTRDGNAGQIILRFGDKHNVIKYNNNGDFSLATFNEENKQVSEVYLINDNIYKVKKNKVESFGHDQFYYFDTTNMSACIFNLKSHGVILHIAGDTVKNTENELDFSLIDIGNYTNNVRYDVEISSPDSISVLSRKQIAKLGIELKIKLYKKGWNRVEGFLYEYHKERNDQSRDEGFILNPFAFYVYLK